MASYSEQMQGIVYEYIEAGGSWPATAKDMAVWAINNKKWAASPSALINRCAEELARARREELITDPPGRLVRAKHGCANYKDREAEEVWSEYRDCRRE